MQTKTKWLTGRTIPGAPPLAQLRVEHRRQGVDAGTFGKEVMEKSSSDMVTAIRNPENTPDLISGQVTL